VFLPGSEQAVLSAQEAGTAAGFSTCRAGILKIRTVINSKMAEGIKNTLEFRSMVMVFE